MYRLSYTLDTTCLIFHWKIHFLHFSHFYKTHYQLEWFINSRLKILILFICGFKIFFIWIGSLFWNLILANSEGKYRNKRGKQWDFPHPKNPTIFITNKNLFGEFWENFESFCSTNIYVAKEESGWNFLFFLKILNKNHFSKKENKLNQICL